MPSLASKWGIIRPAPMTPRPMREAMQALILTNIEPAEVARALRKRYRGGEWEMECSTGQFEHLKQWRHEDWLQFAQVATDKIPLKVRAAGEILPKRVYRNRKFEEEAKAKAAAEIEELGSEDPKKRLDRLRKAILARLTIDEQAELLVSQARGDHAPTSKAATTQIIEILGMKAANVPEAPGQGPIFALPEGAGPSIR